MNYQIKYRSVLLTLISLLILSIGSQALYAQKVKKNRVRLNVQYVKIMDDEIYFDIKASSRIKKKNIKVANIELSLFNEVADENILLGKTVTDMHGESRFVLEDINSIQADSSHFYNMIISFKGNESFKKAKKSVIFRDAIIKTKIITKDSTNYISGTLTDSYTNSPISDESLIVQVQRLFRPLRIGEEFNSTDKSGSILVPIGNGIPGVDGNLTVEVVLDDSDDYGTVKAMITSPIGVAIVDESTFDERTMWSPRSKTPLFLLIFPNLLIIGVWGFIIYLITNLFKLSKS